MGKSCTSIWPVCTHAICLLQASVSSWSTVVRILASTSCLSLSTPSSCASGCLPYCVMNTWGSLRVCSQSLHQPLYAVSIKHERNHGNVLLTQLPQQWGVKGWCDPDQAKHQPLWFRPASPSFNYMLVKILTFRTCIWLFFFFLPEKY